MIKPSFIELPMDLFPCISWFQCLVKSNCSDVHIDTHSNWNKQTARTRYEIAGANKKQQLVIPVIKSTRTTWREVQISYMEDWPTLHWRSLEAAYNRSPYFEFYRDSLESIFMTRPKFLHEWNLKGIKWMMDSIGLKINVLEVDESSGVAATPVMETCELYPQVFQQKYGFLKNLSALDALFNLGPETIRLMR